MNALYLALLLLSAATLTFQVALTRFFALAQGNHLAFMAISLALLGIGASGTYLSLYALPLAWPRLVSRSVVLFSLTVPLAYLAINYLPFDTYRLAWEPFQVLWLILYYLALTVPFFFSGLAVGVALAAQPEQSGSLYAANLLGAGLGPPLALLALAMVGGPGAIFVCTLLGWLAVGACYWFTKAADQEKLGPGGSGPIVAYSPTLSRQGVRSGIAAYEPVFGYENGITEVVGYGSPLGQDSFEQAALPTPSLPDAPPHLLPFTSPLHSAGLYVLPTQGFCLRLTFYTFVTLMLLYFTFRPPNLFEIQLTPYKALFQAQLYPGSQILSSRWNAFSRVDVIQSLGIRSAPGLSFAYTGELPPQLGLTVDGDNLNPLTQVPGKVEPGQPTFSQYLPLALAFYLRPNAETLILEPGGGLALQIALENGAGPVTVVHSNPAVAAVVGRDFADFNGNLYADPRVTLIVDDPRSYLRRSGQQFDLILLPLTDSFRPVTAGAYTLNEDYRYTVEAFNDALAHLKPGGLLLVERWLQLPPSESLRLWGTVVEALRQFQSRPGARSPSIEKNSSISADHLLALRSLQTSLVGVSPSPLPAEDIALIRSFAAERQYDLIWLPNLHPDEINRYNVLAEPVHYLSYAGLLTAPDPAEFYAAYAYAVAPATDDQPFFFHFFKWSQTPEIIQNLGKSWQPFGGSGYLVLLVLLALAALLSTGLILLPLVARRQTAMALHLATGSSSILLYFGLLGLGFLFMEIPLLQRFILYLGQPAYAFAVVVAALLLASGLGSAYLSQRWSLRWILLLIGLLGLIYPLLLSPLFNLTLSFPFAGRVAVTVVALFPLGLLLGIPFPRGLSLVGSTLTPWAWAVNGCASVISAILAPIIALTWGFSAVLWSAALAYALAAALTAQLKISH